MEQVLTNYNFERDCDNNIGSVTVKNILVNGEPIIFYQTKNPANHLVIDPLKKTAFLKMRLSVQMLDKQRTERLIQMSNQDIRIELHTYAKDHTMYVSEMTFVIDYGRAKADGAFYIITFKGEVK